MDFGAMQVGNLPRHSNSNGCRLEAMEILAKVTLGSAKRRFQRDVLLVPNHVRENRCPFEIPFAVGWLPNLDGFRFGSATLYYCISKPVSSLLPNGCRLHSELAATRRLKVMLA
jgi:hypothetical protein